MAPPTLEQIQERIATPDGFVGFLKTKDNSEVMGSPKHPRCCPIAHYLISLGLSGVWVEGLSLQFRIVWEVRFIGTPPWMSSFIAAVDSTDEVGSFGTVSVGV